MSGMKRLRKFLVEILGVPIILGSLFVQYPEVFDAAVPWIALVVLLHLTWEFIVVPSKGMFAKAWRALGRLAWIPFTLAAVIITVLYLLGIEMVMIDLAYKYRPFAPVVQRAWPTPPPFAYSRTPKATPIPPKAGGAVPPNQLDRQGESPIQLSATFYDAQSPSLVISNSSERIADGVIWGVIALRTSDLSYFGFATQSIGYIKPRSESASYLLDLPRIQKVSDGNGQIADGDELTGSIFIDCPQCEIQTYIVHFVWGHAGWFFESPRKAGYIVPKDMSKDGRAKYIRLFTGDTFAKDRIEIKPKPR
jgi:hypothetical protein